MTEKVYPHIRPGLYRHYKGGYYEVVAVARHSETAEMLIIYREFLGKQTWVRPVSMFDERVNVNGKWVRRFERVAPDPSKTQDSSLVGWLHNEVDGKLKIA